MSTRTTAGREAIWLCIWLLVFCHTCVSWQLHDYNPVANTDSIVQSTSTRITVLTSRLFRLEYDANGKFDDRASISILNRYLPTPSFTLSQNATHIVINTEFVQLTYLKNTATPFAANSIQLDYTDQNFNFHYSTTGNASIDNSQSENLLATIRSLDTMSSISLNCTENADVIVHKEHLHCVWAPISKNGYALIDDSNTAMFDEANTNWLSVQANHNQRDWYLFAYGRDYKAAILDFVQIAGAIPMYPRYAYGSWHSRWFDYDDLSMKQVVHDYMRVDVPIDVVVWDMNWHLNFAVFNPWGAYSWNPNVGNAALMQQWFKKQGLRTTGNLHDDCGVRSYEDFYEEFAKALNVTNGREIVANFTNYDYMMALQDIILQPLHQDDDNKQYGFDFWWIDWQQGGTEGIYYTNINPTIWLNYIRVMNHIRRKENVRGFTLGRFGGYGNHRYPVGFSGDVKHQWETLQFEVYFSSTASNVGYAWSHDIMGARNDYQLNTRWIQFGAYSSIFRTHDAGHAEGLCAEDPINHQCAQPDIYTHTYRHLEIERDALQQRAALLPYIYNASYFLTYLRGIQLLYPLYYDFAACDNAYSEIAMKSQYMFGEQMMISPIATAAENVYFDLVTQTIWIPPTAVFYEAHSGFVYTTTSEQGLFVQRDFDLSEIPIYIKANSIIPKQPVDSSKLIGRANELSFDHIEWNLYPYMSDSVKLTDGMSVLYEDDGYTYDYLQSGNNANVLTTFKWTYDVNNYIFNSTVISDGNYDGFQSQRSHSLRVHNILPPKAVYCNGELIEYNALWYGYENDQGWYYNGIDVAVVVNCPQIDTSKVNTIDMEFVADTSWFNAQTAQLIQGLKGKIHRARLCKHSLDERNTGYGLARVNLTVAANYAMSLSDNYQTAYSLLTEFNSIYDTAIQEVTDIPVEDIGFNRKQYCLNLLKSIKM